MGQKYISNKNIFWISILIAIGGLILPAFLFVDVSEPFKILGSYLKFFLEMIHVSLFDIENKIAIEIQYKKEGTFFYYNVLNAFFYILLLIGAFLFLKSKAKETRLLRFIFSIIFLSKMTNFITGIFLMVASIDAYYGFDYLYTIISFSIILFQIYLAFSILKFLSNQKVLSSSIKEYGENKSVVLVETSKWTRFFHHITDNIVIVLVLSPIAYVISRNSYVENILNTLTISLGDRPTLVLVIAFCRMFYYLVFEMTLGLTAAKMLSETQVVDEDGNQPSYGKIVGRTLLRLVPFEALTFFMHSGLHDRSSQTYVVNEKRVGVKGSWYFLIIPIVLIFGTICFIGTRQYKKVQYEKQYLAEENQENELFTEEINNLSTDDILFLKSIDYTFQELYLKVEKIENNKITLLILNPEKDYSETFGKNFSRYQSHNFIEKIYEIEKKNQNTVVYTKAELIASNNQEKRQHGNSEKKGILVNNKQFYIDKIEAYFGPRLYILGTSQSNEANHAAIKNEGWTADLISVSSWKIDLGQLPITMHRNNNVTLSGEKTDEYQFTLKVKDSLNRMHTYEISKKKNLEATLKKLK